MNPLWAGMIFNAAREVMRERTHCKKVSAYREERPGQFHRCHRFKETGK